jgi:PKHD-type hydroxylase
MIYEYDFLNSNQLRQLVSIFDSGRFVDGAKTGPKEKHIKDNKQQDDPELNKMMNTSIAKFMRNSLVSNIHPLNKVSPVLMLKYEEGQHYAEHVDYWNMYGIRTDYTAVILLNDDFEGGEHFIKIGEETIERKPEAGRILFYPSEHVHGVRPVTKGVRKCVTFWLESSIPDPTMRYYISELNKVHTKLIEHFELTEVEGDVDVFGLKTNRDIITALDHVVCGITKRSSLMRN